MSVITCYMPADSGNQYSENIKRCIRKCGCRTVPARKILKNPVLFIQCKIFNFNWYENIDEDKNIWLQLFWKYAFIWLLKIFRKKIVYTVHNQMPHNAKNAAYGTAVMKMMLRHSDAVVGLCRETAHVVDRVYAKAGSRLYIIPHPNYIKNYRPAREDEVQKLRKHYGFKKTDFVLLMLGFVSPYKNIELLLEAVRMQDQADIKLLLAGKAVSETYRQRLLSEIDSSKVQADFRYIKDSEISSFYGAADIAVLPYKTESVLNSGAVYLSFSLGKSVICPDIPSVREIEDKSFLYQYQYTTQNGHLKQLAASIGKAYQDYKADKEAFQSKGKRAYAYAAKYHSMEIVADMYKELYGNLCPGVFRI